MTQPLRLIDAVREFLKDCQGKEVSLKYLREELKLDPRENAWQSLRQVLHRLITEGLIKPVGRNDGTYKVITQVHPVQVFGRERKGRIPFRFPVDQNTGEEMCFAKDIVFREGDLILISGRSNYGKTALCLNFCAENIDSHPVLMGNEYTTIDNEPTPRFLDRLDKMTWVQWANCETGEDRFTLLPVRDDYAEHVRKDTVNIINWINLVNHYEISPIMEGIKLGLGRGVGVAAIQKAEGAESGRGGQFTKDFADVELLLDSYGEHEILMTLGKVKESYGRLSGKGYAFTLQDGVRITYFREVKRCSCVRGWRGQKRCESCNGS